MGKSVQKSVQEKIYKQEHDIPIASSFYVLKLIKYSGVGLNYEKLEKELFERIKLNNQINPKFSFSFGVKGSDGRTFLGRYSLKEVLEEFEEGKLIVRGIVNGSEKYLLPKEGEEALEKNLKLVEENFLV